MIYGEKFLGYNVINESKEDKINKYKEMLDKALGLLEIRYKELVLDYECFDKIYSIYLKINDKNLESNLREIKNIVNQNTSKVKRLYDADKLKEEENKLHKKISSASHFYFTELPSIKNDEIKKLKYDFKNKLNKISNDTDNIYSKYEKSTGNLTYDEICKVISDKTDEIYKKFPDIFEKYEDIDICNVEIYLDAIRDDFGKIHGDIDFYIEKFIIK